MPLTASKKFKVTYSKDNLTATIAINGEALPKDVTVKDVVSELVGLGLQIKDDGKKNIEQFVAAITDKKQPETAVVAQGIPPVADTNGYIKKLYAEAEKPEPASKADDSSEDSGEEDHSLTCNPDIAKAQPDPEQNNGAPDRESHYEKSCFVFVENNQPLVQLIPPTPGQDGIDIFGKPIPRIKGREAEIQLRKNTRIGDPDKKDSEEKADIVYASSYGKLNHTYKKIWVDEDLEVHSEVDFSIGNIDFKNNVDIFRSVLDLFKVKAGKNLTIRGIVEAALVESGDNLILNGGMAGKEKGCAICLGNLECKFITSSKVQCAGDISFAKEIMYCNLECGGKIFSENGQLAGGNISAFKGVKVHTLGSDAGSKTVLDIGINDELKTRAENTKPEVKKLRMQAEKVRAVVEPLLAQQKRLTNEQKEKATELLYETYELDGKADELIDKLKTAYENSINNAVLSVEVTGKIHPNVIIRFPRGESKINEEIKGPVTIVPRIVNKVTKLFRINTKTGLEKELPYGASYDTQWNEIEDYLGLSTK